ASSILETCENYRRFMIEPIIADKEYESWFLAGAPSFAAHTDCIDHPVIPENSEQIRDAKGFFEREILKPGRFYSETVDQAKFTGSLNLALQPELNSRSFHHLITTVGRISVARNT
ncbi:MAG: hypothetical protein WAU86_04895, partial [Oricola sp.]